MSGWLEVAFMLAGVASLALNAYRSRRGEAGAEGAAPCTGKTPPWRALLAALEPALEASFAPRAVALVWWLLAFSAADGEAFLVASGLLACTPGVAASELAAALAAASARQLYAKDLATLAAWRFCWVPWLLLAVFQGLTSPTPAGDAAGGERRGRSASDASELNASQTAALLRKHPDWLPPRKKESKVYQWAFDVTEDLLAVYPCAVHLQVAHQGHLYISENHVSFQGVTIGGVYSVQFRVPLEDIDEILGCDRRGCATLQLRVPVELRSSVKKGWSMRASEQRRELEIGDCEEGLNVLAALCICSKRRREAGGRSSSEDEDDLPLEDQRSLATDAKSSMDSEETPFTLLMEAHLPRLDVKTIADDLLSNDWTEGSFYYDYLTKVGLSSMDFKPWVDKTRGPVMLREIECIASVPPAPMCPKSTRMTGNYIVCSTPDLVEGGAGGPGSSVTVLSSKTSHDVPFGTRFVVQEKAEFIAAEGGLDLKLSGRIIFLGSCGMLSGKIRSAGLAELKKATEIFLGHLRLQAPAGGSPRPRAATAAARASSASAPPCLGSAAAPRLTASWSPAPPPSAPLSETASEPGPPLDVEDASTLLVDDVPTRLERVWELQRRTTVFQNDWKAPFLPHDGRKKWRWTDMNYLPHALCRLADRDAAARSTGPPLATPAGYVASGGWQPELHAETDDEGWEYAVDFYSSAKYWGTVPTGRSVRRRLWTCRFVEASLEDAEAKRDFPSTPSSQSTRVGSIFTSAASSAATTVAGR